MTNFDFLLSDPQFTTFGEVAVAAEKIYAIDPAACVLNCRRCVEFAVKWMYAVDGGLVMPYDDRLASLMDTEDFRAIVDRDLWQRLKYIRQTGNNAAHTGTKILPAQARLCLENLWYFMDFIACCYGASYTPGEFDPSLLEQQALLGELIFKSRHSMLYILNRLNDLHITLSSYYVLSLEVVFQGPLEEGTAMLQQAQDIFLSCCEGQTVYLVPKSDLCSYAVLPLPEDADPLALCTAAVEAVDGSTDFLLTIGISRCHKNPLNMRKAAQEADDAQKFLLSSSQPSVMRCQDLPRLSEETTNLLLEKLRLISLLLSHDLSPDRLAEMPDLDGGSMESLESGLRDYLTSTLAQMGRAPENIDSIIYEVKQYIDQNYSASLSLDALAAMVHLSPSYFSKLFKREMGENLSTYILNTRIEHAKLLLRTTDKKAYEIAEAVGIYDPVYFSKIFKKAVGLKPKEYRERPDAEETERMIPGHGYEWH